MYEIRYLTDAWHTVSQAYQTLADAEQEKKWLLGHGYVRRVLIFRR